jgi:taurine dioxygenase
MITVKPTGEILGATVTGLDLKQPLSDANFALLLRALGDHGVLRFPQQLISAAELKQFSSRFGGLQVLSASKYFEPETPEVTILSNIEENGKPIGKADAGQFWHTDMTYNHTVGFVNVLVAHAVPMRDGKPLGATEFTNTQAAFDDLPQEMKQRLADATATHYLNKNWEYLRESGKSSREPLTAEEIRERPPVHHSVFLTHPITGRKVIYVNPSFVVKIDGMPDEESAATLDFLFDHVMKPKYRYTYRWTVEDVLMWDHLGTWHNAVADYGPKEHRLMKRCQVLADRIFDAEFVREKLGSALAA